MSWDAPQVSFHLGGGDRGKISNSLLVLGSPIRSIDRLCRKGGNGIMLTGLSFNLPSPSQSGFYFQRVEKRLASLNLSDVIRKEQLI